MDGVPKLDIDQYISPLSINGMKGRMLRVPAQNPKKKKEILLVYGHHASLERMVGMAQALSRYGAVTTPDMPGFGGMDSFYKIGKKPTIDNLADYLAAFIKMRYKKQPITIIAVSLGFAVATRMLQKYPDLAKRVDVCVSAVGFINKDDIKIPRYKKSLIVKFSRVMSWQLPALLARAWLCKPVIRWMYHRDSLKATTAKETEERRRYRIEFEVWLWQHNDIRTHFFTLSQMLSMNLCHGKVNLPVYHIAANVDQYLDNHLVEQHMRVVFTDFTQFPLPNSTAHAPTIVATAKEAAAFIPHGLRRLLSQ